MHLFQDRESSPSFSLLVVSSRRARTRLDAGIPPVFLPHRQFPDAAWEVCAQACECWQVAKTTQSAIVQNLVGWEDSNLRMAGSKHAALSACRAWCLTQDRSAS